jgi:hypothetical protein
MKLTPQDIEEFRLLCEKDGFRLSPQEAEEGARRLIFLYEALLRPTSAELKAAALAKSGERGIVEDKGRPNLEAPASEP